LKTDALCRPSSATRHRLRSTARNSETKKRNHDEIRLLAAIINNESFVSDDNGVQGGLTVGSPFVILGDLNADPDEGSTLDNPMEKFLLGSLRIAGTSVPVADSTGIASFPQLDPDDTAQFGLRVDYVLPSSDFEVIGSGVYRSSELRGVSDHFPVWVDVSWPRN
jgi:endonuclease/exonuclease/phosphatase family metal-dependent hydrolase